MMMDYLARFQPPTKFGFGHKPMFISISIGVCEVVFISYPN